jgi:Na+/melibiose symporter-like transporter
MKKYSLWFLLMFLVLPLYVIAQTVTPTPVPPILTPPVDTKEFITWFFSSIKGLSGASSTLVIAFILAALIGSFKAIPFLKKYWDKLGKWAFVIPLAFGAGIEILMNFPKPFAWGSFISYLIAGAFGTGTVAIAVREIWVRLFPKPITPPTP